ncbi:MAG: hypothetical protein NTZ10_02440 [Candidatus Saganbacteria bacterium]|nr:hypothetical protein [Candidatus Saganbacteria bacterium]
MKKYLCHLSVIQLLLSCRAFAVDAAYFSTTESSAAAGPSSIISFGYIVQLIFSLLVVFGFIYLAAKYVFPKFQSGTKGRFIEIVDRLTIEPQVSSYIIKAGKSAWLIVVSGKTVAKIDKLEEDFQLDK